MNVLLSARSTAEVRRLASYRRHSLAGDRKGRRAMTLHGPWRLIVEAMNERGTYVLVKEVSNHHD